MPQRITNGILLLIAIVGLVDMLRARSELGGIRAEHDQLAERFGTLEIGDPDKFYVQRIPTDNRFHFAWRVYQPDGLPIHTRTRSLYGSSSSSRSSAPGGEGIMRVRFRFEESGPRSFVKQRSGSSTSGFGNRDLAAFLKTHWDALEMTVLAEEGTAEGDTDQLLTFLSIQIPKPLVAEAEEALGRAMPSRNNNTLFEFRVGTPDAFQNAEQTGEP